MDHVPITKEDLESLDERDLLEFVADKEADQPIAERAMTVLYKRHYRRLVGRVRKMVRNFRCPEEDADDLVQDAMIKVFESAESFKVPEGFSENRTTSLYLAWVFQIAQYIFHGYNRSLHGNTIISLSDDDLMNRIVAFFGQKPREYGINPQILDIVRDHIDELPNHKKEILLSYIHYRYYEMNVPNDVLDELASRHGTTRVNMRQIYSREMKKMKSRLEPILADIRVPKDEH